MERVRRAGSTRKTTPDLPAPQARSTVALLAYTRRRQAAASERRIPAGDGGAIPGTATRTSETFVRRVRELCRLEGALHAARRGGSTVHVAGEAGHRKTRLACELATRARATVFEIIVGRFLDRMR